MREIKKVNARFLDKPNVGDLFVNADRETAVIPRYRVTRVGKTIRLEGVDTDLDFTVFVRENARFAFKRIEQTLESASAVDTFPPPAKSAVVSK